MDKLTLHTDFLFEAIAIVFASLLYSNTEFFLTLVSCVKAVLRIIIFIFCFYITAIHCYITNWQPIKLSSNNTREESFVLISQDAVYRSL